MCWEIKHEINVLCIHKGPFQQFSSIPGQENFIISSQEGAVPVLLPPLSLLMCPQPGQGSFPVGFTDVQC